MKPRAQHTSKRADKLAGRKQHRRGAGGTEEKKGGCEWKKTINNKNKNSHVKQNDKKKTNTKDTKEPETKSYK